jgi:hypothetical protein
MYNFSDNLQSQVLKIEIRPFEGQNLADPQPQTHGNLHHLSIWLLKWLHNDVILVFDFGAIRSFFGG